MIKKHFPPPIRLQSKLKVSNLFSFTFVFLALIANNISLTASPGANAVHKIEVPKNATITSIKEINNKLYVGTRSGLYIQDLTSKKWENLTFSEGRYPTCITNNNKLVVLGTNKGILINEISETTQDTDKNNFVSVDVDFKDVRVNDIYSAGGTMYFATDGGVFRADENIDEVEDITSGLKAKSINTITVFNNKIIIGSSDGLFSSMLESINWRIFKTFTSDIESIAVSDTSFLMSNPLQFKICQNYDTELEFAKITKDLGEVFQISANGKEIIAAARGGVHISIDNGVTWKSIVVNENSVRSAFAGNKMYFGTFLGNLYVIDPKDFGLIE